MGGGGVLDQRGDVESSPLKGLLIEQKLHTLSYASCQVIQEGGEVGEQEVQTQVLLLVPVVLFLAWLYQGLQQGAGCPGEKLTCFFL